jgi:endonuclease/exonuclease/phosphatase family metal-dependent hydrolase
MEMRIPLRSGFTLAFLGWLLSVSLLASETIRIATYNVENYLTTDLVAADGWRPNYPKPEKSKNALRSVIAAVNPDVLALQEMGREPFLRELQRDLRAEGVDYPHAYVLRGHDENRHVALLSRLPFREVHAHIDLTFPYFGEREAVKRGLLEVVFETNGEQWSLFVIHLKSKWTERPDDPQADKKRTGEATAVRNRILERQDPAAGALYLIAGDLNDTRDTAPLRRLLQRGSLQISELIPAADSRGHAWTQHWARQNLYSRVDYLLPSPALARRVVDGRGYVYDGPGYSDASDHRMVWADFALGGGTSPDVAQTGRGGGLTDLLRVMGEKAEGTAPAPSSPR